MIAYIPIASCQLLNNEELGLIVTALNNHTLIDKVLIVPENEYYPRYLSMRLDKRGGTKDLRRYKAIAENCLSCYETAIKQDDEFFLMCNSNKMEKWIPYLYEMRNYMVDNKDCGMVAPSHIKVDQSPVHICAGFAMHRTGAIKHVRLNQIVCGDRKGCHCPVIVREIREAGYTAEYCYKD